MTDEEILNELLGQQKWWEKRLNECKDKMHQAERELEKVTRLIELLTIKQKL